MNEFISTSKYCVGGHGPFEKWWYRAEVHSSDGNYGLGFGAQRESAIKRAFKDLAKGGRNPVSYADKLGKDGLGRVTCVDKSGRGFVLRGKCWARSLK